jgi:hypothetical protein
VGERRSLEEALYKGRPRAPFIVSCTVGHDCDIVIRARTYGASPGIGIRDELLLGPAESLLRIS